MSDVEKVDHREFVVKSKVRVLLKEADMKASDEIWDELGRAVTRAVKMGITRAKANKRKTVKACDI